LRGAVTAMGMPGSDSSSSSNDAGGDSSNEGSTSMVKQPRSGGAAVGAYLLSYLDETTLIGRASGSGGTFIFERAS